MINMRYEHLGSLLAAFLLLQVTGCGEPSPDPDGLIMYIKKARVGDKVRRLWPEGQQYANAVMKADSEYRKTMEGLHNLRTPESLWKADDKKWRDKEALEKAIQTLDELTTIEAASKCEETFKALGHEIANPPTGVDAADVWDALAYRGEDLKEIYASRPSLLVLAGQHKKLLKTVQQHAGSFDTGTDKKGLTFVDKEPNAAVLDAKRHVQEAIDAYQQKYRKYVEDGLEDANRRLDELKEKKEELKAAKQGGRAKRDLEYRIDYQMARRKMYETEIKRFKKGGQKPSE